MYGFMVCWRKSNEKIKVYIFIIFNVIIYFFLGLDNWIKIKLSGIYVYEVIIWNYI